MAAATVYLRSETGRPVLNARTDPSGGYRFSGLAQGIYMLRVDMPKYREATVGPCPLGPQETKTVDLMLELAAASTPRIDLPAASAGKEPQFFDEPQFTVAGVTEAANPGGHGSETIWRTTETLAKETATLSTTPLKKYGAVSEPPTNSSSTSAAAEDALRKTVEHEPEDFDANLKLGKLLVDDGEAKEAIPFLDRASQLNPGDYQTVFELARACAEAGQYQRALSEDRALLARPDNSRQAQAELHGLMADVEENMGNPLEAVREYQQAAELNPSEPNLFDWGVDLLIHRAYEPAIEVFAKGNRLFPGSARMLTGLGVASYARGAYDQATQNLCAASDLKPDDPTPYLFLGKMQSAGTTQAGCLREKLGRFARLQPGNATASYYFALSLWQRNEGSQTTESLAEVESLLKQSIHLDPKFGPAYLRLGILYSDRGDVRKAIAAYQEATAASPELVEAHYRLAQAYSRTGEKSKAQAEAELYKQLSREKAEQADHERREIQQFVYTLRDRPAASQTP